MSRRPTSDRVRGRYIGSHDVAAIVGANPWRSPADVYAHLALNAPRSRQTQAMTRGLIVEHGLIAHAAERLGHLERDTFWVDDSTPYLCGSVDGITGDGRTIVEVTTCSEESRRAWGPSERGLPSPIKQMQVQYFLGLTGAERAEVLCLDMSSDDLLRYVIEPDRAVIDRLFSESRRFWREHIEPKIPPHAMDGWGRSEHLDLVWPGPPAGTVVEVAATDDIQAKAREYAEARATAKSAEERKQLARDQLHALLGNATLAKWDGGKVSLASAKLEAKTDWAEVAISLRDELGIPMHEWSRIVTNCTHERHSQRRIDVRIKGET